MIEPYYQNEFGKLYCGKSEEVIQYIDEFDLCVTSPPYDNLRKYNGYTFDFEKVADCLSSKIKKGGVIVWVVGDATIKGSETGTSFKQALYFKDQCGLNLHDTMIYQKANFAPYDPKCNRYYQEFEYMFVLSNKKPSVCNYIKIPCLHSGGGAGGYSRNNDGSLRIDRKAKNKNLVIKDNKIKANIWKYSNTKRVNHPAPFPEQLALDHIKSWSNEGDLILDPFIGSGTTAIAAEKLNRKWIGIEISEEYCEIAAKRIENMRNAT